MCLEKKTNHKKQNASSSALGHAILLELRLSSKRVCVCVCVCVCALLLELRLSSKNLSAFAEAPHRGLASSIEV